MVSACAMFVLVVWLTLLVFNHLRTDVDWPFTSAFALFLANLKQRKYIEYLEDESKLNDFHLYFLVRILLLIKS